jgi:hypothetical protein
MKIHFHKYVDVGFQSAKYLSGLSGVKLERLVKKCTRCEKIKYEGYEMGINYNDESFNWQPQITELLKSEHYINESRLKKLDDILK